MADIIDEVIFNKSIFGFHFLKWANISNGSISNGSWFHFSKDKNVKDTGYIWVLRFGNIGIRKYKKRK